MKQIDYPIENNEQCIEVITVLRLNKKERKLLVKQAEPMGNGLEVYLSLPFACQYIYLPEFNEDGEIELGHQTDKDSWYTNDEQEISCLESMILDDVAAVKRYLNV